MVCPVAPCTCPRSTEPKMYRVYVYLCMIDCSAKIRVFVTPVDKELPDSQRQCVCRSLQETTVFLSSTRRRWIISGAIPNNRENQYNTVNTPPLLIPRIERDEIFLYRDTSFVLYDFLPSSSSCLATRENSLYSIL